MGLNTYPSNPFPPSTDRMDADVLEAEVNKLESDVDQLKSGLTNLDNEVNGDATVYPYADVITISDAVPANLADCNVKIEPVQDLHGYANPWVGGAGKNKFPNDGYSKTLTEGGMYIGQNNVPVSLGTTLPAGNYVISFDWSGSSYSSNAFGFNYYNGSTKSANVYSGASSRTSIAFTASTDFDGITLFGSYAGTVSKVQLESGSSATTYAPYTNICPITGHTEASVQRDGVNIWDENYAGIAVSIKYTAINVGDGNFTLDTTTPRYAGSGCAVFLLAGNVSSGANNDDHGAYNGSPRTQTAVNGYVTIAYRTVGDIDPRNYVTHLLKDSDKQTYTIALGDTIYGGTVDFDSGVMTVTHRIVDMGSIGWTYNYAVGHERLISDTITNIKHVSLSEVPDMLCSVYETDSSINVYDHIARGTISINDAYKFVVYDNQYTDGTAFATAMTGQTICYPLAAPTTVQLTPQQIQLLKGTNTLTASTGQISVTVNGVSGAIGQVQEQVNELESDLTNATTVSSGTITAQEGVTITRYILQKSIKTVFLFMLVKFTPTLETGQLLCVLPSGYRAPDRLLFAGKNGTTGKLVTCETDSYGAVRVYPTSDDSTEVSTDYFLTITYFVS